jgi:hypothetical protein
MKIFRKNKMLMAAITLIAVLVVSSYLLHITSRSNNKEPLSSLVPDYSSMSSKVFKFVGFKNTGTNYLAQNLTSDQTTVIPTTPDPYNIGYSNRIIFDKNFRYYFLDKKAGDNKTVNNNLTTEFLNNYSLDLNDTVKVGLNNLTVNSAPYNLNVRNPSYITGTTTYFNIYVQRIV